MGRIRTTEIMGRSKVWINGKNKNNWNNGKNKGLNKWEEERKKGKKILCWEENTDWENLKNVKERYWLSYKAQ